MYWNKLTEKLTFWGNKGDIHTYHIQHKCGVPFTKVMSRLNISMYLYYEELKHIIKDEVLKLKDYSFTDVYVNKLPLLTSICFL